MFLALKRINTNKDHACMRQVIRDDEKDLRYLEMKCLAHGGEWRIHKTVNARCPIKAMKYLMKKLIDHPELCADIDMEWRSALLQPECAYGEKRFMLDVDFEDNSEVLKVVNESSGKILQKVKSPKGWHLICTPFDTRKVCLIPDVSLHRDGYFYIETVK